MQNLSTHMDQYLFYCAANKNLDSKTVKAYRIHLSQFLQFIENKDFLSLKDGILAYIVELNSQYQARSVKRKIASVKVLFTYLAHEEILQENPFLRCVFLSRSRNFCHEPFLLRN